MKLSLHADLWNGQVTEQLKPLLDKGMGWAKLINSPDVVYGWALAYPTKRFVYRKAEPADLANLSDWMRRWPDPIECAEVVARHNDITPAPNLYVEGINEPRIDTPALASWLGRLEARRSQILKAKGLKAVVGNFATGSITPETFAQFLAAYSMAGGDPAALIGIHEYGLSTTPVLNDGYNMLSHRRLYDVAGKAFLWLITEIGCDYINVGGTQVGGGWRDQGISEEEYWAYLNSANTELEKDPYVVAAFVFTFNGTSRWQQYELRNAPAFNKLHLEAQVARTYTRGIDISYYQTVTSVERVKAAGFQYVFIRNADEIRWPDVKFAEHWAKFRGVLPRSQYQYVRYTQSGKTQADFFIARADKNDLGEMPRSSTSSSTHRTPRRMRAS